MESFDNEGIKKRFNDLEKNFEQGRNARNRGTGLGF